jgi:ribosomal protein S18 acetylase RimI-like enzyme
LTLPKGYSVRPVDRDRDFDAVIGMLRACDLHDVGFADANDMWVRGDWASSMYRGAWLAIDGQGDVVAYLVIRTVGPSRTLDIVATIAPEHRTVVSKAWFGLSEACALEVAPDAPALYLTVAPQEEGADAALRERGFELVRTFWHMERDLDPAYRGQPPPPGATIRPLVPGRDEVTTWQILTHAFEGHFLIEAMPFEEWLVEVTTGADWDPSLVFLAEVDGDAVGVASCSAADPDHGWIDELGVLSQARGRGIGLALLERGFEALAARGLSAVRLNVDAGNETGATRLYEKAGMTVRRAFHAYEKRLDGRGV